MSLSLIQENDEIKEFHPIPVATKKEEKEEKEEKKTIWDELSIMVKQLEKYDYNIVKKYIDDEMLNDKADLIEEFEKDFSDIDNTDTLKLEVLVLLGKLGITIYS